MTRSIVRPAGQQTRLPRWVQEPARGPAPAHFLRTAPLSNLTSVPANTMQPNVLPPLVNEGQASVNATWKVVDAANSTTCLVNMLPYLGWSVPHAHDTKQPTVSPVPSTVEGFVQLDVYNNASYAITAPWSLRMLVPAKTVVTGTTNANASQHDYGFNGTHRGWSAFVVNGTDLLLPYSANAATVTVNLTSTEQDFFPRRVLVNGTRCNLQLLQAASSTRPLVPTATNTTANATINGTANGTANGTLPSQVPGVTLPSSGFTTLAPAPGVAATSAPAPGLAARPLLTAAVEASAEQPVSAVNGKLVGVDGKPLTIRGVNWFGFETGSTFVDGLWQGPTALTQDFGTVAYRIQLLGFNTVRLPFSFQVLYNMAPRSFTAQCQAASLASIYASTVRPGDSVPSGVQAPQQAAPSGSTGAADGVCNEQVPNNSVYARFLWVLRFLTHNGFYVVIDNHLSVDNTAVANPQQWAALWAQLLSDIVVDPASKNRVMVDILNEPDARGLGWSGTSPDMSFLYLMAMDALHQVSPSTMLLVEGNGQLNYAMNWGDGFVTDRNLISQYRLADANKFFGALLAKPYLNNVVISPHYYPPSVSLAQTGYTGSTLWSRMTNSFGYLTKLGYGGHAFPVVIGETGSSYANAKDTAMLTDMAKYMNLASGADDGLHAPITNLIWWSFNANSGDTGGIVDNDWLTIMWNKVAWLEAATGLLPWYKAGAAPTPPPPATPPPTTTPKPTTTPEAAPAPPTKAPTTAPRATTTPADARACSAAVHLGQEWSIGNGQYSNVVSLALKSTGSAGLKTPYQLAVASPVYTAATGAWNWQLSGIKGGEAAGPVTQGWETLQPRGGNTVTTGAIISSTSRDFRPASVSVNGVRCALSFPLPALPGQFAEREPAQPAMNACTAYTRATLVGLVVLATAFQEAEAQPFFPGPGGGGGPSCVSMGQNLQNGACAPMQSQLTQNAQQILGADCATLSKAVQTQAPSAQCCADTRAFVTAGCTCDQQLLALAPLVGVSDDAIRAAGRVSQVSSCASNAMGGEIELLEISFSPGYWLLSRFNHECLDLLLTGKYDLDLDTPAHSPCTVIVRARLVSWTPSNASVPSATPGSATFRAALDLTVFNNASVATPVPWTLMVEAPFQRVADVFNAQTLNATRGANASRTVLVVSQPWQALAPLAGSAADIMLLVDSTSQDVAPRHVAVNGQRCRVRLGVDLNAPLPDIPAGNLEAGGPLTVRNGVIYDPNGAPLVVKGVNWFGFDVATTMVDGLWAGSTSLTKDFPTVVWRLQLLGFNTIRLPFSFQSLFRMSPVSFTGSCTNQFADSVKYDVGPPGWVFKSIPPPLATGDVSRNGWCNGALPNSSVYTRFLYVLRYLARNNFYVVADNQFNLDNTAKYNPSQWVAWWAQLARDINADPLTRSRVIIDVLNEPDSGQLSWGDMTWRYLSAMDAIHQASPQTLMMVQGTGQTNYGICWGDGFVTDPGTLSRYGLDDARPFFNALLGKPYLNSIIVSPHVYPPSVSKATWGYTGPDLWRKMTTSFGYLNQRGYGGHRFPVIIGETGSYLATGTDIASMQDIFQYLRADGGAADGQHACIPGAIWWAWNANAGDVGGITNPPSWETFNWNKVNFMRQGPTNLAPWFTSAGYQGGGEDALPPSPPTPPPTPPPSLGPGNCTAAIALSKAWEVASANLTANVIALSLTATGAAGVLVPFRVALYSAQYRLLISAFNWQAAPVAGGVIAGNVKAPWQALRPHSASAAQLGMVVQGASADLVPTRVLLNDRACTLVTEGGPAQGALP
ncbi:hypothetical protein WJX81_004175 [Elliptochloris bilobata]|uniref:Glycoside hydrolase family 5 domain-containing protein n=1 Tax=Elliptochloris bilobata TaxID=381761 RepID=A0AAW1RZI1_9CHLO